MYNREEKAQKKKSKREKKHENASLALLFGIVITFYSLISLIGILTNVNIPIQQYMVFLMTSFLLFGIFIFFLGFFTLYPRREEKEKKLIFLLTILTGIAFLTFGILGIFSVLYSYQRPLIILILLSGFAIIGSYLVYYGTKMYRYDWDIEF